MEMSPPINLKQENWRMYLYIFDLNYSKAVTIKTLRIHCSLMGFFLKTNQKKASSPNCQRLFPTCSQKVSSRADQEPLRKHITKRSESSCSLRFCLQLRITRARGTAHAHGRRQVSLARLVFLLAED